MNYRHAFHAGNFADVHKHIVLLALLERLKRKPTPLFYLDTHAGRGWYDLQSSEATRGGEWRAGVGRLGAISQPAEDLERYLHAIAGNATPPRYPGSPILAVQALRPGDRAVLVEQQPHESDALKQALHGYRNVSVIRGDGYASVKAQLPPKENRGLVLIDPPYESENELTAVREALQLGLSRWPHGMFALWYPIKAGAEVRRLYASLRESGLRKLLRLELTIRPADSPAGLNGSGLIVANPPWQLDTQLAPALKQAHAALAPDGSGASSIDWLVPE